MNKFDPEAIFSKKFLAKLQSTTRRLCNDAAKARAIGQQKVVTKKEILREVIDLNNIDMQAMGIDTSKNAAERAQEHIISHFFNFLQGIGALPGVTCKRGQFGGVCLIGADAVAEDELSAESDSKSKRKSRKSRKSDNESSAKAEDHES